MQLSIPDGLMDPIKDPEVDHSQQSMLRRIEVDILLMSNKAVLAQEPVNGLTWLLCTVVWLKLSCTILNKGTQKEATAKFQV